MALGKRKDAQQELWVATTDLPKSPGHPFYQALNRLLAEAGFDRFAEAQCEPYYAKGVGRPGIPPGVYFRMLMIGYFEGIGSQRGIAWRCSDSLSLRAFLGLGPADPAPDHSSLTIIRQRLPLVVHEQVFAKVLAVAQERGLLDGKTVAMDTTTLEANAAMKSIVRKDNGDDWKTYLRRLAQKAGVENPTDADLRRFDKHRKGKKVSNQDWQSPSDPDSRITKMKDGRTHLAYKADHAIDLESQLLLSATIHPADRGDAEVLQESLITAQANLILAGNETAVGEVVADSAYHKAETLAWCGQWGIRTYIPERDAQRRRWDDKPPEWRAAVYANRRRVKGTRSKGLQRRRSECVERTFAHSCETGGGRRTWLRGFENVSKRYLIHAASLNLGVILRAAFGVGTPRSLQDSDGLPHSPYLVVCALWTHVRSLTRPLAAAAVDPGGCARRLRPTRRAA